MSITRAQATNYLIVNYTDFATEAGYDYTTVTDVYAQVIDQAFRQLGIAEADLASAMIQESRHQETYALFDYYALARYLRVFAIRSDVSIAGALTAARSQVFKQVQTLFEAARQTLAGLGLDPANQMTMGRFPLDIYEPDYTLSGEV